MALHARAISSNRKVEAKALLTVLEQVWDSFPSFCDRPTDLNTALKGVVKQLADIMKADLPTSHSVGVCLIDLIELIELIELIDLIDLIDFD